MIEKQVQNPRLIDKLKPALSEIGEVSSWHGVPNIIRNERPFVKILWIIIILISMGACAFILSNVGIQYFAYEVVTKITVQSEIPAQMPSVVICNSNGLMGDVALNFSKYVLDTYNITQSNNYLNYKSSISSTQLNTKSNMLDPKLMVLTKSRDSAYTDAFRKSLGLSISDMLVSCTFHLVECSTDYFQWQYDTYYGNCYRFIGDATGINSSMTSAVYLTNLIGKEGVFNGLSLELFVGEPTSVYNLATSAGIHVFINNVSITPNSFEGLDVAAGTETNFLFEKQRVKKIQIPYGECTPDLTDINSFDSDLYRTTFKVYKNYRQKDCFNMCFQKNLIDTYGCYSLTFPYITTSSKPCLDGELFFKSLTYFSAFFQGDVAAKCSGYCPLECDSETYSVTTSSTDYPSAIYAVMLGSQKVIQERFNNTVPTYDQLKRSMVSINLNYNELRYTQIEESQKTTIIDFVSNIGGTMGLFLGISFLSFFEIVEVFLEIGFIWYENRKSKTVPVKEIKVMPKRIDTVEAF